MGGMKMSIFTVITKGNKVRQYHDVDYLTNVRMTEKDYLILRECGSLEGSGGNPITWPTDATSGLQAIVDIKAGTLRFGITNGVMGHTEFVVSEYVAPFVSVEDCELSTISHPLGLVTEWPKAMPPQCELEAVDGCKWEYVHGEWILSDRLYNREFHEGHWLNYHENKKKYAEAQPVKTTVTAASMLTAALGHMEDRAKTYDAPGGERSMGKTVAAFNIITGHNLTEEAGWLFMEILKQVRSQKGNYRADNYEDMVAYAALRGECAARERGSKS